ncbi:thioredoxin 1 [Aurantimicrobium minutum]|uniref:thioredoxin n=1 Tax=Aurantimicrobium minutum TaxID=708131 RepID=UPI0024064D74|nr:thioredoxin [Aurantimicrobium minutum]MDF9810711.1 thioredoxin 1 [Aurantimicrobium minutum]
MASVNLTVENFDATIMGNDIVVVDFWADWCGPCKMFAPTYEAASEKDPQIVFGKVDTEVEQSLAAAAGIQSIPTLMIFRDSILLFSQAGALPPAALDDVINQVKALDMVEVHAEIAKQQAASQG